MLFLSCKANARVKLAKTGHGPHSSHLVVAVVVVVLCVVLCKFVLCYCHRVSTKLQLTNILYHTLHIIILETTATGC